MLKASSSVSVRSALPATRASPMSTSASQPTATTHFTIATLTTHPLEVGLLEARSDCLGEARQVDGVEH